MLRHLYSRVYLTGGRRGCSARQTSVAASKVPSYFSKVGDDVDVSLSPVKIYQGSSDTVKPFHAHDRCGKVRLFSAIRNIPRDKALKYMLRFEKANSTEAIYILEDIELDGFIPDVFHYSAAISKCAKDGKLKEAKKILRQMNKNKVQPNEITMNSLIDACAHVGNDKEAIKFLREMEEEHELWPDVFSYSAAISACGKAGNWEKAIELLREMQNRGVEPNVISYSSAISACEKGGQTEQALQLLVEMENRGIEVDEVTFNAAISACGKGGAKHTETALALFREMCNRGVWPNVISYNTTISACEKGGAEYTDTALQLFEEMKEYGVEPTVITYSATISACEKGGAKYTQAALGIFDELQEKKISPTEITFSALISACGKSGDKYVDVALRQFNEMKGLGISPGEITYTAIIKTCYDNKRYPEALESVEEAISTGFLSPLEAESEEWDLHQLREAEACMLIANALVASVDTVCFKDIRLVTGRGKTSLELRGEGPVLQLKVPAFIRDVAGLQLSPEIKHGKLNEGAFILTKTALKKWAKSDDFDRFRALMTGKKKE